MEPSSNQKQGQQYSPTNHPYEFWLGGFCHLCHMDFETPSLRNAHLRQKHTAHNIGSGPPGYAPLRIKHPCAICMDTIFMFDSWREWRNHDMMVHRKRIPLMCPYPRCKALYWTLQARSWHYRAQHMNLEIFCLAPGCEKNIVI
jgi:hypothetical protein